MISLEEKLERNSQQGKNLVKNLTRATMNKLQREKEVAWAGKEEELGRGRSP